MAVVNGWQIYVYPTFEQQLRALKDKAKSQRSTTGKNAGSGPAVKLLRTIEKLILELIPADPGAPQFRQGNTLGKENRQWFRVKFHERYRLFFRFSTQERAIVYVWMNNEDTLRKRGSKTDAYAVFESMLESGEPPKSFDDLLARARAL